MYTIFISKHQNDDNVITNLIVNNYVHWNLANRDSAVMAALHNKHSLNSKPKTNSVQ